MKGRCGVCIRGWPHPQSPADALRDKISLEDDKLKPVTYGIDQGGRAIPASAHQASLRLDAQFPWLTAAFAPRPTLRARSAARGHHRRYFLACQDPFGSSAKQ